MDQLAGLVYFAVLVANARMTATEDRNHGSVVADAVVGHPVIGQLVVGSLVVGCHVVERVNCEDSRFQSSVSRLLRTSICEPSPGHRTVLAN